MQTILKGPTWGMVAVFLLLWVGVTVRERPAPPAGKDLGYQIGAGVGAALGTTLAVAAIIPLALRDV